MTTQQDLKATTPPLRGTPPREGNKGTIQRAMESCVASVHAVLDQFRGITKLIVHGKGGESVVNQWLTTAADGNLSVIPTGSQNYKQWRASRG